MTTPAEERPTAPVAKEGTVEEVVRGEAAWCVVHGDALHVLGSLFRALARDVGAEVFTYDPKSGSHHVAAGLVPELLLALGRWATRESGTDAGQVKG